MGAAVEVDAYDRLAIIAERNSERFNDEAMVDTDRGGRDCWLRIWKLLANLEDAIDAREGRNSSIGKLRLDPMEQGKRQTMLTRIGRMVMKMVMVVQDC